MPDSHESAVASAPLPELADTEKYTAESIIWMRHWTPTLFSFRVSRDSDYQFIPGQFARLGIRNPAGEFVWRAYSVCSAKDQDFLEFYSVVVPDGRFSSRIVAYQNGDIILVERKAQGFLTADRFYRGAGKRDLWMLATGTGVGPYISILQDAETWRQFDNLIVVHSVRLASELAYAEAFSAWQAAAPFPDARARLHYVKTVTREQTPGALGARINVLIENAELEKATGVALGDERSRFMLCGNPEMVEQTRKLLKERGFRNDRKLEPGHIAVENYW
jgi:ferredoxin/flavodoxin---NADP+ reductase